MSMGAWISGGTKDFRISLTLHISRHIIRHIWMSAHTNASAAYIASVARCAAADSWPRESAPGWSEAVADFCDLTLWTPDIIRSPLKPLQQHSLSKAVDKSSFAALVGKSPLFNKARLLCVRGAGAGSWLAVPSKALNSTFDPREFTTLLRFWLGMPVYEQECACPWCGACQDPHGYHALVCKKTGLKVKRHNGLREVFLEYCKMGQVDAERETAGLLPDSSERPADILLRGCDSSRLKIPNFSGNSPVCLDFAVTHTQQIKYIERAGVESGVAAQDYESKVKRSKYEVACREQGLHFVPMVVEVFGTWGKEATPVMDFISKAVAHHKNLTYEQVDVYLRQKASIVLQRHNARALLRHRDPDAPTVDGPVLDV